MRRGVLVTLALVILAPAGPLTGEDDGTSAALAKAEGAVTALGRALRQHLGEAMQSGGPTEAVRVCSEVAQDLAAEISTDGMTVRRVSLRPRNPAGRPDAFEREALLELEELHRAGKRPTKMTEIVTGPEGRQLRYLRPIVIASPCLNCHGPADSLDADIAAVIAERYPEDEATGYSDGDLRGAFSVTVPVP